MKKIIFFDTETTGNTENDTLVQIAYKTYSAEGGAASDTFTGLYKPSIRIPPEASAVHHITNKMVADKPTFAESPDLARIKQLFEDPDTIVVAHNAPFDLAIIKKEGIVPNAYICTLRLARHLDKDEKIDRYNLQYLRYLLEIEIDATAHDALGDVLVLEKLYERLKDKVMTEYELDEEQALKQMIDISSRPTLLRTFHFGKYKERKIKDVAREDPGYLQWLLREKQNSGQMEEDWIYTLEHYLGR